MSDYSWFRLYHDMPFDPKLRQRFDAERWWAWVCVLCLASASDKRGTIPRLRAEFALADAARIEPSSAAEHLAEFVSAGLLRQTRTAYHVVAWGKRQFKSDLSTPRVREFRERYTERFSNVGCNAPENREQKEKKPVSFNLAVGMVEGVLGRLLSSSEADTVMGWARHFSADEIELAVAKAVASGKPKVPYIGGILANGVTTSDAKNAESERYVAEMSAGRMKGDD